MASECLVSFFDLFDCRVRGGGVGEKRRGRRKDEQVGRVLLVFISMMIVDTPSKFIDSRKETDEKLEPELEMIAGEEVKHKSKTTEKTNDEGIFVCLRSIIYFRPSHSIIFCSLLPFLSCFKYIN